MAYHTDQTDRTGFDTSVTPTEKLRSNAIIVYVLYLASFLAGVTGVIGVVIAHMKVRDAEGTVYHEHFKNQIVSFWTTLIVGAIGALTMFIGIGYVILFGVGAWFLYRTVRGLVRCVDGRGY